MNCTCGRERDDHAHAQGFHDRHDFEPQPWERCALAALKTWMLVHDPIAAGVWRVFVVARAVYRRVRPQ